MSALGLGGYASTSDSESDSKPVEAPAASVPGTHGTESTTQASTSRHNTTYDVFERKKPIKLLRKGAMPLFYKPVVAEHSSDSDDERMARSRKSKVSNKSGEGLLSFLPEPVNALRSAPVMEEEVPTKACASDPIEEAPDIETAETFRIRGDSDVLASQMPTMYDAPAVVKSLQTVQNVQFKEIKAESLQAVAPHEQAEMAAIRTAMGSEHAKELQASTSGKHEPSKRQKQRHQINSLYHQAKLSELQDMENKLKSTKSKAETAAKYGW